jgi:hypothetical protein
LKEDIVNIPVEGLAIAAVIEPNIESNEPEWTIYIINKKDVAIQNVLVSSKGYGEVNNEKIETSQLRHFLEDMPAKSFKKIEPIMPELFKLNNQYWISFYIDKQIYEKKYVFLAETIQEANLTQVPIMNKKGVLLS